jgi:hypothetical protein
MCEHHEFIVEKGNGHRLNGLEGVLGKEEVKMEGNDIGFHMYVISMLFNHG